MVLFLLFLVPASVALLIVRFNREGNKIILPLLPFLYGLLLFLPSLLLQAIVVGFFEDSYTAWGLFVQTLFREHFLFLGFAVGWAAVLRYRLFLPVKQSSLYNTIAFFGGYYAALNVSVYLERVTRLDFYTLFLLPALTLATVVLAALLLVQYASFFGVAKFASLAALICLPFLTTIMTVLYARSLPVFSIIGTIVMAGVAGALFIVQKEKIY